jgi:hypothetical protein
MVGLANEVGPKARSRELLTTASDELSLQAAHSRRSPPRSLPAGLLFNGKDFCGNGSHLLPLSTSDFAGDGSTFKASGVDRHQGKEKDLRTIAPLAAEGVLIRSPLNRSINQQFAVYSEFATMSRDKAKVTHRRRGRQTPNPSLGGPWWKFEPLFAPEPFPFLEFPPEP